MTTTSSLARSARRRAPALLGVALFALVIAACGSSSPTASTSSTTAPGASAGATTTYRLDAQDGYGGARFPGVTGWLNNNISSFSSGGFDSAGGTSLSSKIGALSSQVQAAEKITFKAVYTTTGSGSNGSVTIEQAPPKSALLVERWQRDQHGDGFVFLLQRQRSDELLQRRRLQSPVGTDGSVQPRYRPH